MSSSAECNDLISVLAILRHRILELYLERRLPSVSHEWAFVTESGLRGPCYREQGLHGRPLGPEQ